MLTSPKGEHLCFSATLLAVHPHLPKKEIPGGWRARVAALKNIPRLLAMVWETSPDTFDRLGRAPSGLVASSRWRPSG